MFAINKARTGIHEFDAGIEDYIRYLAMLDVFPDGRYALAGGAIRSLFDNTPVKDLDLYILGNQSEHANVLAGFPAHTTMHLENPFSMFEVINLSKKVVDEFLLPGAFRPAPLCRNAENLDLISKGKPEVQMISLSYDSDFTSRVPAEVLHNERFPRQYATSLDEIIRSFDLTICKAGIEFTIYNGTLAVSEVKLPANFLSHVAMRKMAFSAEPITVPQQLCTIKRFYKYLKYGYQPNEQFFVTWHERVRLNPHILSMSYANDAL